jgi:hypothetical protein
MLGVRLGYAIGGAPHRDGGTDFLPIHAEGRFAYWFGHHPFRRKGFRFYAAAAGGIAEMDSSLSTFAIPSTNNPMGLENQYTAWTHTGTGFVSLGVGGMFAFTPSMGVTLEVKGMELFPTSGTGLGASLGYAIGF